MLLNNHTLYVMDLQDWFSTLLILCGGRIFVLLRKIFITGFSMKIIVCQLNPLVGDVQGNAARICETLASCASSGADLLVFPELFFRAILWESALERDGLLNTLSRP